MTLKTDLTNSDDEGTLSALSDDNSDDSDVTIPYEYASTHRFSIDDHISDLEFVEFEADGDLKDGDYHKLETHEYIADRPLAPLSMSFEEEEGFPPEKSLAPVRNIMGNGATSIIFFQEIGSVLLSIAILRWKCLYTYHY